MKYVYIAVSVLIFLVIIFGFVAPTLISTKSDIAVIVGGVIMLGTVLTLTHAIVVKFFKKEK